MKETFINVTNVYLTFKDKIVLIGYFSEYYNILNTFKNEIASLGIGKFNRM